MKKPTVDPDVETLIAALHDYREGLRQFAIRRAVNMGTRAVPALIPLLKDKKEFTRESAAIILATMGPVSVPFLMESMKSEDSEVRWGAAWVLSSMPPEIRRAIPRITLASSKEPAKAGDSGLHHGVWSDSWLTKVRERLETNKAADVISLVKPEPI